MVIEAPCFLFLYVRTSAQFPASVNQKSSRNFHYWGVNSLKHGERTSLRGLAQKLSVVQCRSFLCVLKTMWAVKKPVPNYSSVALRRRELFICHSTLIHQHHVHLHVDRLRDIASRKQIVARHCPLYATATAARADNALVASCE